MPSGVGGFPNIASNDTYGAIAYQFILGGAMPIRQVPGLALTAEYRFFGVGSRKCSVSAQAAPGTSCVRHGKAPAMKLQSCGDDWFALQFQPAATAAATCSRNGSTHRRRPARISCSLTGTKAPRRP